MHDCRSDRVNLKKDFGIVLGPVFDTQIAYHFVNPSRYRVGWNKLCKIFLGKNSENPLKEKIHGILKVNEVYWKKRPLTSEMINYAAADVIQLHSLYHKLDSRIWASRRNDFEKMCAEATLKEGQVSYNLF